MVMVTKKKVVKPAKAQDTVAGAVVDASVPPQDTVAGVTVDGMQKAEGDIDQTVSARLDNYAEGLGELATVRAEARFGRGWAELPVEVQNGIVTWAAIGILVEDVAHQNEVNASAHEEMSAVKEHRKELLQENAEAGAIIHAAAKEIVALGGKTGPVLGDDSLHGKVDNLKV